LMHHDENMLREALAIVIPDDSSKESEALNGEWELAGTHK